MPAMTVRDVAYRLRRILVATAIGALLTLLGCASGPTLQPAPNAEVDEHGLTAEAASVVVSARANDWEGTPDQIDGHTPVRVRLKNKGDRPVRIRYKDFQLAAGDSTITPVAPRAIEGTAYASIHDRGYDGGDRYASQGFHVAPHHLDLARAGHSLHGFGHGFGHSFGNGFGYGLSLYGFGYAGLGYGRSGYGGYGSASRTVRLPTRDMLLAALPEGFLEPGGSVEGFIYFPTEGTDRSPDHKDAVSAPFTVTIVHAKTSERLGHLSIPFVYDG